MGTYVFARGVDLLEFFNVSLVDVRYRVRSVLTVDVQGGSKEFFAAVLEAMPADNEVLEEMTRVAADHMLDIESSENSYELGSSFIGEGFGGFAKVKGGS